MSMAKTAAGPQEELPVLTVWDTDASPESVLTCLCTGSLVDAELLLEVVVLIASIRPASSTGSTNPELHLES